MAQPLNTSPKVRWGIPLVLPHVLLSVGLLAFAALSERPASSGTAPVAPELAAAMHGTSTTALVHQTRRG